MGAVFNRTLLSSKGLKSDLAIALGLISLALLVFLGYLFPGVSSWFETKSSFHVIVILALFIVTISFIIITQIVAPVIKMSREARMIADGDFNREILLFRDDEIGQLGSAINRMTRRMKENVEELQNFTKTTESINREINQRILVLSNLLQVSNLISQNADLKEIIEVGVEKCLSSGVMTFGALILKDKNTGEYKLNYVHGSKSEELLEQGIKDLKIKLGEGLLGKTILKQNFVILDHDTVLNSELEEFRESFLIQNGVIIPVSSKGNVFGLLIAGNDARDFVCKTSELELLHLISKQIAIAYGNELLKKEIEKLEVVDRLTGLFNHTYAKNRLNEEIKRSVSFQRPCSFVLISVDRFKDFRDRFGHIAAENVLLKVASALKDNISPVEKAARFSDHEFGLILPEKNKRQSIVVAELIRTKIEEIFSGEEDVKRLTCTSAVTENPIDGMTAQDLILKAEEILKEAKAQGGNKVCYKV